METPASKEVEVESKKVVLEDAEIGHEGLIELEVDLATVVEDDNIEYSYESHRSPFPEGMVSCAEQNGLFSIL